MSQQIKPAQVKELRERTGAGMMDCKQALVEAGGDIEQAADILRKAGQAKADKKASRVAADGKILIVGDGGAHVIAEVNSETDFVANDENFKGFADLVVQTALEKAPADLDALMQSDAGGQTIEQARLALVAKVGENIAVRRFERLESSANVAAYLHMNRIGVLIELEGGDADLARDLAMQIAATSPHYVSRDDVPAAEIEKEREILVAQAEQEGKPANIVEKMVEGRLRKHFDEIALVGQPFVKDPDTKVGDLLAKNGASVQGFIRYELGEGVQAAQD